MGSALPFILEHLPTLLRATVRTVELAVWIVALATILAFPLVVLRQSANPLIAGSVAVYSWVMRTLPLLIMLFFGFYGLPRLNVTLPAFQTAIVFTGVQAAAYYMEIVRGGVLSVGKGQFEASRALGLAPLHTWRRIILPQVIPVSLPGYISNTIIIMKGTSVASIITVSELTGVGNSIISITYRPLEILLPVAVIYLFLNSVLTILQHLGERHWSLK
jgi:His/Glu/Gln/Arg/opine family amino acid ABC transporter permease subunit